MKIQTEEQIGVCSWSLQATGPLNLAEKVNALGLKKVQMGLTPHRDDPGAWDGVQEILAESGIRIVSGMFSTVGEDYTTPDTIRKTGGIVPDEHWEENLELAKASADTARMMGLKGVNVHAGFLPHDPADPDFDKLSGRVATLAEVFGERGVSLYLETGQETAQTLLAFLGEMKNRGAHNVAVNFDPANMILYDMDDPIEALFLLAPHVRQVHVKDAKRTQVKGQWGEEVIVGTGEVDWVAFVRVLAEADFEGGYIFEREAGDNRVADIAEGIAALTAAMKEASA
ncbi:MAG: Xylose isomerase-like TIM barrel [Candidatus Hydrogenedentes bacterium ADurb.Bin101]|jgi:sugar phosphate isomerase/epimerase|nr:MAG: Xylose isomerase-like TIM barrel [Candidatus Hydrogenedentes bacterium ADurb.Bin101]HOC68211.1 sugar phosphate isomerase/epimerase family protein [Candidatus Hydrogenedentota bacterium]